MGTICHVGANYGEDILGYEKDDNISQIILIEGNPLAIPILTKQAKKSTKPCIVIPRLISDKIGEEYFHTVVKPEKDNVFFWGEEIGYPNYGCCSLMDNYPGYTIESYKLVKRELTKVTTLSEAFKEFNIDISSIDKMVFDIQDAELKALKGFKELKKIPKLDFDINHLKKEGCEYLISQGFLGPTSPKAYRSQENKNGCIFVNNNTLYKMKKLWKKIF